MSTTVLQADEFPRDEHGNPSHHRCLDCGYVWQHGRHGGHDCKARMRANYASLQIQLAEVKRLLNEAKERLAEGLETECELEEEYSKEDRKLVRRIEAALRQE